jgi:aspartate-semialdehyde dehydrogenase
MRVAIIGATGVVGQTILQILEERRVDVDTLLAYASRDHEQSIVFRGVAVPVRAASTERVRADRPDVVFFASSDDASQEMAEALAASGAIVIDNSATFRLDPRVPLVVPEVNATSRPPVVRSPPQFFAMSCRRWGRTTATARPARS